MPQNATGDIASERKSSISASGKQAFRAVLSRYLHDRDAIYIPIGDGAQIEDRGKWVGECRAIANSNGDLIVEQGRHQLKRPEKNGGYPIKTTIPPLITRTPPVVIEDDGDIFGGRNADRDPTNIPDDEDPKPGRPSSDRRDEVEIPYGEYRTQAVTASKGFSRRAKVRFPPIRMLLWHRPHFAFLNVDVS